MALTKWRGDAQPVRQIQKVSVTNVGIGDIFKITCNRKTIAFTATDTTAANVYSGLSALLGENATIPEFTEITPLLAFERDDDGLWLQGPEDGTPFTVSVSKTNGSVPGAETTTIVEGSPGLHCKQTVTAIATGGTFTLSFNGVTTTGVSYNATPSTVETALESLSSVGSGNVNVSDGGTAGNQRSWVVEFVGPFAYATQPLLVASGAGLTGNINGIVTELQKGSFGTNHKFRLVVAGGGQNLIPNLITFTFENPLSGATSFGSCPPSQAAIQTCLQGMTTIGLGNVVVTGVAGQTIEFVGALSGTNLTGKLTVAATYPTSGLAPTLTTVQVGSGVNKNEKQVITFDAVPSGGTWALTYAGQTASSLAYDITGTALLAALEGLSNIGSGDIGVTKTTAGGMPYWTVEFTGALASADQPMMTTTTTSLQGGPAYVVLTQEGAAGIAEVQQITLTGFPDGGTFTITYSGQTTASLAWNAAASLVQSALEALSNIGNGDISVSGAPAGPYTVTFQKALLYTNVVQMTADGTTLTASISAETISLTDVLAPTGPNWYSEANNWSGAAVPSTGDTIIFEDSDVDCLYGIVPSSIPQSMTIRFDASYTGRVGLSEVNPLGYFEYRDKRLRIGDTSGAVSVSIGQGDGDGSTRIRVNTGVATTTIDVWTTDQADDDTTRAFDWVGTHASNVARVHDGQMAIAPYAGETATVATLTGTSNADILAGPGATLTTITSAGDLLTRGPLQTSLAITDGTCTSFGSLNSSTVTITGGTWEAHNNGTATSVTVGPGDIDCAEDYTAKTFTTFTIKANANISDPNKTITATNLARGTDVQEIITR